MPIFWLGMEKLNLTQQKHTFTNKNKYTTTQNKHAKVKPGLVASYDIWPENGGAYSYFGNSYICHLLTYLDIYPLTYSTALDPHRPYQQIVQWLNEIQYLIHIQNMETL